MKNAVKFVYDATPFYLYLKKHFCPICGNKLELRFVSKIVNSKSPEAKDYDFSNGDTFFTGDVEFITRCFHCLNCKVDISVKDMKKYEKESDSPTRDHIRIESDNPNKDHKKIVKSIIDNWDPIDIMSFSPDDEYEPEILEIEQLLCATNDVNELADGIYNIFRFYFNDIFKNSESDCVIIAKSIIKELMLSD